VESLRDILALMQAQRNLLRILLALAAIFYLVFIFRTAFDAGGKTYLTLVDDAMISMRYARNLVQGNGLTWNAGEPPVEGFTNLGWTLTLALIHLIPLPAATISLVVMLLAGALLLGNVGVVFRIVQTLQPAAKYAPLLAATTTAFYFPLVYWSLRGLEVGALSLCLNTAVWVTLRTARNQPVPNRDASQPVWLPVLLAAALLIRMDAVIAVGLILFYLALRVPRRAVLPTLVCALALASILFFQKAYFGDFLPNTYYLKINGVSAWERIRTGLLSLSDYASRDFLMLLFFGLIGLSAYRDLRTHETVGLLLLFLAQAAYSIWVGGDYAEELVDSANRFITQGMPALIVLFSLVIDRMILNIPELQLKPAAALLIGVGALFVISGEPWIKWTLANAPMLRTDIQRAKLGLQINHYTQPEAVIAVHAAGQIPYFSERKTIDLLGKSDPVIAKGLPATNFAPGHNKWDYEYSIVQLRPDVVADNFNKLRGFMADHPEYVLLPNGIYVRGDSRLVDVEGLSGDYH
jgi:hypothetical protein